MIRAPRQITALLFNRNLAVICLTFQSACHKSNPNSSYIQFDFPITVLCSVFYHTTVRSQAIERASTRECLSKTSRDYSHNSVQSERGSLIFMVSFSMMRQYVRGVGDRSPGKNGTRSERYIIEPQLLVSNRAIAIIVISCTIDPVILYAHTGWRAHGFQPNHTYAVLLKAKESVGIECQSSMVRTHRPQTNTHDLLSSRRNRRILDES